MESQQQEGAASNAFNLAQSSGRRSPAAAETGGNNKKDGANLNGDTMQQSMPQERVNSGPRNALHQWSVLVHDRHLRQQLQEDDIELEIVRKRFEEGHSISRHGRPHTYNTLACAFSRVAPTCLIMSFLFETHADE